jgi:hypothetical protein
MARTFNGSTQYLSVSNGVVSAYPCTFAVWFRANAGGSNQTLLGIGDNNFNFFCLQAQGSVAGDPVRVLRYDGSGFSATTTTGFTDNVWHHACGVLRSANDISVFIDGGSEGTDSASKAFISTNTTRIGVTARGTPTAYHDGEVAEVAIWDNDLIDSEIGALAKGFSPLMVRPGNLVFYVPLIRDNDDDIVGGLSLTAIDSPTVSTHTRVFYSAFSFSTISISAPPAADEKIMQSKLIRSNQIPIHQLQL